MTLAARVVQLGAGAPPDARALPSNAIARVTQAARLIERHPDAALTLGRLARDSRLSPYHFLPDVRTPHRRHAASVHLAGPAP